MAKHIRITGKKSPQLPKPHRLQVAQEGGIVAVRRPIDPTSYSLFATIAEQLSPEFENAARLFTPESLGITVVGFSKFSRQHRLHGPRTADIAAQVATASLPARAKLGTLSVYGSGKKHKLGFSLESAELATEITDFERAFQNANATLKKDHNNPTDVPNLHCSIALLYEDTADHFRDEQTLVRLTDLALATIVDTNFQLQPAIS
jgi:hypothetical protein